MYLKSAALLAISILLFDGVDAGCKKGGKTYTVASRDTCYGIWTNHGLTENQWNTLNPGIDCSNLDIGQKVCISSSSSSSPTSTSKPSPSSSSKPTKNVCRSYTDNFKDAKRIVSEEKYNGKPKTADWIDISGNKKTWNLGPNGLEMRVLSPGKVKTSNGRNDKLGQGATLNSTYSLSYGSMEAKVKMSPVPGIVTAVITMSDGSDEVDWEWVGGDLSRAQSNYYYKGIPDYSKGRYHAINLRGGAPIDNSKDWSIFRLELQPEYLKWYINGQLVRTVFRNETLVNGVYRFPSQTTRVQIGLWDSSDNTETAKWAKGPVGWNSLGSHVSAYIEYIKIECDPRYNKVIS